MGGRAAVPRALWGFEQRGRRVWVGGRRSNGLVEAVETHVRIATVDRGLADE
jgi:hypothetical protein